MRTIIAGSRDGVSYEDVCVAVEDAKIVIPVISEVVSGAARGTDKLGERWAKANRVPIKSFPAQWQRPDGSTDKAAGHKRNRVMAEYADALIAIWDGRSPGTKGMIEAAQRKGLVVYVYRIRSGHFSKT